MIECTLSFVLPSFMEHHPAGWCFCLFGYFVKNEYSNVLSISHAAASIAITSTATVFVTARPVSSLIFPIQIHPASRYDVNQIQNPKIRPAA
jgi:hypothetical protein